jgi:hypothetical protein
MLGRPSHHEAVQGFQFQAPAGHEIVVQGGEAARFHRLAGGEDPLLGGRWHRVAVGHRHRTDLLDQALEPAQAASTVRISPIGSRTAAVMPAWAQMKASLAHSSVTMAGDSSAPKPARWQEASSCRALAVSRPSSSPNTMLVGPPVCTTTPGSAIPAKM